MLYITDENESPTITITQETITFDEDTRVGTTLAKTVASCSDPDRSDTLVFTIENSDYSAYFAMNEDTSRLTLAQEWDLESENALPTTTDLTVMCIDSGGKNDTKTIHITVSPVNEFDPVISPTTIECDIYSNTTVVETLGEITNVSDSDYGDDGNFYYSVLGVGVGSKYFTMTQTGLLRLKNEMTLARDKDFKFTIGVSDQDKTPRSRTAYCTVEAHYTAPPEEVPEVPTYCLTCTTEGKLAVSALAILGLIFCGFLAHCFHHCYSLRHSPTHAPLNETNFSQNITQGINTTQKPSNGYLASNSMENSNGHFHSANQSNGHLASNSADYSNRPIPSFVPSKMGPQQPPSNIQQQNQQNQLDNDDDDDVSLSDDSDLDERLLNRSNEPFPPRNPPLPGGIDAATVPGQFPYFGAVHYA